MQILDTFMALLSVTGGIAWFAIVILVGVLGVTGLSFIKAKSKKAIAETPAVEPPAPHPVVDPVEIEPVKVSPVVDIEPTKIPTKKAKPGRPKSTTKTKNKPQI